MNSWLKKKISNAKAEFTDLSYYIFYRFKTLKKKKYSRVVDRAKNTKEVDAYSKKKNTRAERVSDPSDYFLLHKNWSD